MPSDHLHLITYITEFMNLLTDELEYEQETFMVIEILIGREYFILLINRLV